MLLSPRSLGYARFGLESLLENSLEPLLLCLITDSGENRRRLEETLASLPASARHRCQVHAQADLDAAEQERLGRFPALRAFRRGHPCWRKITDPLLLAAPGEEIVLLDPDLYFPNQFAFEPTPSSGLLLMWQRPNCLLPQPVVEELMRQGIPLAHHVDIGVAHWRGQPDLEWLEWLVSRLGAEIPRLMHIEAIVWAALAMRYGGGYLDPVYWHCWARTQTRRIRLKLGRTGAEILGEEDFSRMKCFHAGGEAKNWIAAAHAAGLLDGGRRLEQPGRVLPFVELRPSRYQLEVRGKSLLRSLGYYSLLRSS